MYSCLFDSSIASSSVGDLGPFFRFPDAGFPEEYPAAEARFFVPETVLERGIRSEPLSANSEQGVRAPECTVLIVVPVATKPFC